MNSGVQKTSNLAYAHVASTWTNFAKNMTFYVLIGHEH